MIKTEKKYWKNGYQQRGGYFNTLAFSVSNYGSMLIWYIKNKKPHIEIKFYKLIK